MENTTVSSCHRPSRWLASLAVLAGLLAINAQGNEAVSATNAKIEATYGGVNDTYSRGVAASLSIPVAESWGIQFDTMYNHAAEDDFYGAGAHFFTRKPEIGLLGLFVGGIHGASSMDNIAVAVEGEYYFDWLTVGAFVGYDHVENNGLRSTFSPRVNNHDDFVLANLYAAVYPVDNVMVRFDYTNRINRNFYDLTVEYQTPVKGLAAFVVGGLGDADFYQLMGGIRYYIGKDKALKRRHREDDPMNPLSGVFQSPGQASGQNPPPAATPAAPPAAPPPAPPPAPPT
jgi:hypothetical protein|uniref:hypothetical protein n=1 Tax=Prosthecobacter sp. TaxID=1965333 RepID=UPI003784BEC6